ncbi:MAG: response regulator transcription factor [Weeksellaceae bacterium]
MHRKIKIGIVDDHQLVIDGLKSLLKDENTIEIIFSTTQPLTVLDLLRTREIDLLLLDIIMPEMTGNILAKLVKEEYPAVKLMALSMDNDGDLVNDMIKNANILGYALKNISQKELVEAIQKIDAGGYFFSKEVIKEMNRSDGRKKTVEDARLTRREIEIIQLIEQELSNREIAEKLFISERTVETHRKNIYRKTNTNSVLSIVKYMYENNLG